MSDHGGAAPYHARLRPRVAALDEAFHAFLAAADAYADELDASVAELEADGGDPELVRRLRHQRREVAAVTAAAEAEPLEALLRIIDRLVMIRHTEEGRFV